MRTCETCGWGKLSLVGLGVWAMLGGIVWAAPPAGDARNTPPQNTRRDNPQPPPENIRREAPTKQFQPPPPGPSLRHDDSDATKDLRRRSDAERDTGKNAEVDREPRRAPAPDRNKDQNLPKRDDRSGVGKGQPPVADRSRIDDVRKRLDRQDRGKANPGPAGMSGGQPPRDAKQPRFSDRLKTGDLNRLSAGQSAKQLRLADQYRLWQQGDVARRLELQKHGPPPKLYHGVVSPAYQQYCFQYRYWGPSWFAGVCWYPKWNPWVQWSWYYHCHPWWDPRPIWCRPVVYLPCPLWVYWATPAWQPLPVVACGTWVDFSPVALPPQQADLQLVAVRFVDPGHPEEKLGPRYRVWFRNNGAAPVTQPFNVMLFASNDERLAANLPQAGVRVTAIEAGDIQSVDIRLPVEVYTMGRDAQGNPAPFSVLHVLVDANREVPETNLANNGARLAVGDILPVDPAAFEIDPVAARPGGEILLAGEGFGPQPGRALVVVGGQEMDAEILGWYDLGVRLALPRVAVAGPTEADVVIVRGDGAAANPLKVTISP